MNTVPSTITIHVHRAPWYVRLWRSIARGRADGSTERPFGKAKHAFKSIPVLVPENTWYYVEIGDL